MPIVVEGKRIPRLLARKAADQVLHGANGKKRPAGHIRIALINNMGDAALEDTEAQFFHLLDAAGGDFSMSLKLYSLPELPRNKTGQHHLMEFYSDIRDLLNGRFDGVIMTGTEPCQSELREEPYWPILTEVLEWAERETASTILSCLAAHAGVLHSDGVSRHRLSDKQFGVFDYKTTQGHPLMKGTSDAIEIPHSRWNEVRASDLAACGYEVLTQSASAGVDLFVKKKRRSLFLHFQGHPEYGMHTLLKEYRRDIKRFLRKERETYPTMPHAYFDAQAVGLLSDFQEKAIAKPTEALMEDFPATLVHGKVRGAWQSTARTVYHNWLEYLAAHKEAAPAFSATTPAAR
jgi:homoserine O-succinyltransferase/O-acetyltransferase